MDFLKKRDELIGEHKAQVKHDPGWKGSDLVDRPIAFIDDEDVVVVGDCVTKVFDGLKQFKAHVDDPKQGWAAKATREPVVALVLKRLTTLLAQEPGAEFRTDQRTWNCVLYALEHCNPIKDEKGNVTGYSGINVVLTDGR